MAVFRVEKTRDYTVMANHHLRNTALSLKAKGLLSLMLSLPDDWDYTLKGLAKICRAGRDKGAGADPGLHPGGRAAEAGAQRLPLDHRGRDPGICILSGGRGDPHRADEKIVNSQSKFHSRKKLGFSIRNR